MRKTRSLHKASFASLITVFLLNLIILSVWQFDLLPILSFFPGRQVSNPVTSLCFILSLSSLLVSVSTAKKGELIGKCIILPVLVISTTVFCSIVFQFPTFVDKWLFAEKLPLYGSGGRPNYMAPNTALCFVFLSLSLLFFGLRKSPANFVADILALVCSLVSFTSIIGYLYGANEFYGIKSHIPIAFPTAVSFFLVSLAVLSYRSRYGIFRVFTAPYLGTQVARSLIPCALILPVILGGLRVKGEQAALFSSSFGVALIVSSNVLIFIALIWRVSIYLNRTSRKLSLEINERIRLHNKLEGFNRVLEKKIDEKTKLLIDQAIDHQKNLLQTGIEMQEKERNEIGMELHDNVNQVLASASLYLDIGMNSPNLKDEMIRKSKKHIHTAISEIRSLSKSLVSHSVACGDLNQSILEMIAPIEISRNIRFDVSISENISFLLSIDQLIAVFRIIQEQLNNILKYADASNVLIKLEDCEDSIKLLVKDDGKGFDPSQKRSGIGLSNIESRSALFHGRMSILSSPGKGCELKVAFPLKKFYDSAFLH